MSNNYPRYTLHANGNDIVLQITGYDEPNNGRSLWLADLYINDELKNELFQYKANYLNFNLDNYRFNSPDNNFIFIPVEDISFVIETKTLQVYYMPATMLSTLYFLGNCFIQNKLIVVYNDCIQIFNMADHTIKANNFKEEAIASFIAHDNSILLNLKSKDSGIAQQKIIKL